MNSKKLKFTILSISILTVMAGAAMAPALWAIKAHFADKPDLLIQFIVSLPALFIIVTNLFFGTLCRLMKTRTLAITGLVLYVFAGCGAFFLDNIAIILVLRALLGVSVGMIMPLSTGLLSYYFPPEEQSSLMGLGAAMNQLGGMIATMIAGVLAKIDWNYAFLVYLMGLVILVPVLLYLPNERLAAGKLDGVSSENSNDVSERKANGSVAMNLKRFFPSVCGMFLLMICFFVFPTNFAAICAKTTSLDPIAITILMVSLEIVAILVGMLFGGIMKKFRRQVKYVAPVFFFAGYLFFAMSQATPSLLMGCLFIGLANGVGVPYLNTIASLKAGQEAATTVMPLLSAALYGGQFISPLLVTPLSKLLSVHMGSPLGIAVAPYWVACMFCLLFLMEMFLTRKSQCLQ